jgi:hypothetical protein
MKISGVPFDQGNHPQGSFAPTAVVLHRTYGTLTGDGFKSAYSIGKDGRGGVGIGFHFLVGKHEGQWVQFYDTNVKSAHAKGANSWAIGIEFDGVNDGPLTAWQINAGAIICAAISEAHGIPLDYYDGQRKQVACFLAHASVPTSTHTDRLTQGDWSKIVDAIGCWSAAAGGAPVPAPAPAPEPAPVIDPAVDLTAIAAGIAAASKEVIKRGSRERDSVKWAQALLNQKLDGADLVVDGIFGTASVAATKRFQRNVKDFFGFQDMRVDGIIGPMTWYWLTK